MNTRNPLMARTLATIALLSATLSGCASLGVGEKEYACPGKPDGVSCVSTTDLYEMTDGDDYEQRLEAARRKPGDKDKKGRSEAKDARALLVAPRGPKPVVPELEAGAVPIRTPARVMRIWVAPWETEKGDLHLAEQVYTEVEPRRWQVGLDRPDVKQSIRPLEVGGLGKAEP